MFVPTKSSLLRRKAEELCDTVVFKSKKNSQQKYIKQETNMTKDTNTTDNKLDLKKLRYEVIKFGSSGFDVSKKQESRVALAVALGAKPPKKKNRKYVEILAEKKAEKEKRMKETQRFKVKPTPLKETSKRKPNSGKRSRGLLSGYGKVRTEK